MHNAGELVPESAQAVLGGDIQETEESETSVS
jgi:hypothetical protein